MGTRFTTIRIPSSSEVYVFGSVLHSATANDLDIVAIYDDSRCLPSEAYQRHAEMVSDLKQTSGLPVHLTLLTNSEERGVGFIKRTGAIPIVQALSELTLRSSGTGEKPPAHVELRL